MYVVIGSIYMSGSKFMSLAYWLEISELMLGKMHAGIRHS